MANENDEALSAGDVIDGAIEEAGIESEPEETPAESADASLGDGSDGAGEAAAPAAWTAPSMTQAQYEAMQRNAEIGARYSPHAQSIDAVIARALNPQAAQAQAPAAAPAPDEYDTLFGTPEAAQKWGAMAAKDMNLYLKGQRAIAKRAAQEAFKDQIAKIEAGHGEMRPALEHVLGWAETAGDRFATNPETAKWWDRCVEFRKAGLNYTDARTKAQEWAAMEAKAKGATPAQAVAAGKAVGAAINAQAATGKAPAAPAKKRPDPVDEPTLRSGGGKKSPPAQKDERIAFNRDRAGRFEKDHVDAALASVFGGGRR